MGSLEGKSADPPVPPSRRRGDRPELEIPCPVLVDSVPVHTETVAIALTQLWVYSTGFEFSVQARIRSRRPAQAALMVSSAPKGRTVPDDFLRVGVEYADGARASNLAMFDDDEMASPILRPLVVGGGERSRDWRYWVWPLPPTGPLTFICEWPAFSVPETRAGIDANLVLEATSRCVRLWPEDS